MSRQRLEWGLRLSQSLIDYVPAPEQDDDAPTRALIFDSWYDNYRGVIVLIRVVDGTIKKGSQIYMKATEQTFDVLETGVFTPHACAVPESGDVGFCIANIKDFAMPGWVTPLSTGRMRTPQKR